MASSAGQRLLHYGLPVAAAGCFAYAGREAWCAWQGLPSGEGAALRARWERDSRELNERRVAWTSKVKASAGTEHGQRPFAAQVIAEVHNMEALGPAGILLRSGDTVQVLEEGAGMEQGFNVVRSTGGEVGIFPKPYLQPQQPPASSEKTA
mmetsp:Transcript_55428/g.124877  ORF Transcript_55428/g.124877 Transcript_55428/m.124877 type:complete len:151 (+) Transcript_55428:77-529(+)